MKTQKIINKVLSVILIFTFLISSVSPGYAVSESKSKHVQNCISTAREKLDSITSGSSVEKSVQGSPTKRLLIKYKNGTRSNETNIAIERKLGKKILKKKHFKRLSIELLEVDESNQSNTVEELKKMDNVDIVQPDYQLTLNYVPEDEMYPNEWGLKNTGQVVRGNEGVLGVDINAEAAWNEAMGTKDIIVAVLDTGIDIDHDDLNKNIYKNTEETPGDGIDNDGNGKIDDVNGWDFANDDSSVFDNAAEDEHGTHVAGIIAASMNQKGTVGIAPNVTILPLKFIKNGVGYTSDALEAIEYAQKCGARIVNCSWGGTEYNAILEDTMKNSQMLFVCAAGNNNTDIGDAPVYPASFKLGNLISVTACDNTGKRAWYASYGKNIDIAAPGVEIVSTAPNNTYKSLSGTSMSAGFVSGAAALISSKYPDTSANGLKSRIIDYAQQTGYLSGVVYNNCLLDVFGALTGKKADRINETGVIVKDDSKEKPECPQKDIDPNKKNALPFEMTVKKANVNKVTIRISLLDDKYSKYEVFIFSPDKKIPLLHQARASSNGVFEIKNYKLGTPYSFEVRLISGNEKVSYCGKLSFYTKSSRKDVVLAFNGVYKNSTYGLFTANSSMADGEVNQLSSYTEVEPDNSPTQCNFVPFSGLDDVAGYISSTTDEDWYALSCNSAGKMNFWLGNVPSGCDYDLKVYKRAENGALIEFGSSTKGSDASEPIEQKPVNQYETYFIKVHSASGNNGTSQYKLYVNNNVSVTDDYCNEMQNARLFYSNSDTYGKIDYAGDIDWLAFSAQASGNYTVNTSMRQTSSICQLPQKAFSIGFFRLGKLIIELFS